MIKIFPILCRAGTMDNYAYLLTDEKSQISAIIDPSEVAPIQKFCETQNIKPKYVLNTHHHFDHTDGNLALKNLYNVQIVGHSKDAHRIPGIDICLQEGDYFQLGESQAQIISVDGHTIGHILYYFANSQTLFTGDMLFNLCIGGIFEGTAEQMWQSIQKIKALPEETRFYPGHEYTRYGANEALYFSQNSEEVKKYLEQAQTHLQQGLPTGPYTLKEEKQCNPYLTATDFNEFVHRLNS